MIQKLHEALFPNNDILFLDDDFGKVKFFGGEIGILSIDLDKINPDDVDFYEVDPETIIDVRLLAWCNKFEKLKVFKKEIRN